MSLSKGGCRHRREPLRPQPYPRVESVRDLEAAEARRDPPRPPHLSPAGALANAQRSCLESEGEGPSHTAPRENQATRCMASLTPFGPKPPRASHGGRLTPRPTWTERGHSPLRAGSNRTREDRKSRCRRLFPRETSLPGTLERSLLLHSMPGQRDPG